MWLNLKLELLYKSSHVLTASGSHLLSMTAGDLRLHEQHQLRVKVEQTLICANGQRCNVATNKTTEDNGAHVTQQADTENSSDLMDAMCI